MLKMGSRSLVFWHLLKIKKQRFDLNEPEGSTKTKQPDLPINYLSAEKSFIP